MFLFFLCLKISGKWVFSIFIHMDNDVPKLQTLYEKRIHLQNELEIIQTEIREIHNHCDQSVELCNFIIKSGMYICTSCPKQIPH